MKKFSTLFSVLLLASLLLAACAPAVTPTPEPAQPTAAPTAETKVEPTAVPTAEAAQPTEAGQPTESGQPTEAAPTNYSEMPVTINDAIAGTLTQPKDAKAAPAVLMLHGFASQKDEVGDMYKRLAAALAEKGIASLRIDYRGWGESKGKMEDSTIDSHVEDAKAAYAVLASQPFVDPKRIGVLGFSMGGGIAIITAAQNPTWFKSMTTWSSVGDWTPDYADTYKLAKFDSNGVAEIDLGWRKITLKEDFFKSFAAYDLKTLVKDYPGALLMIAGDQDFSHAYIQSFVDSVKGAPKEAFTVTGGDHIYGVLGEDQAMAESVIAKTVTWFNETL